ncbi:aromatic acid exporter family protein, partial [Enterococcus faecalis]|uniref:aromatic acid exporter family protein n=1 Tax=Enterococcus faecalis TaxID=1351 RepID=UPI003CC68833
VLSVSSTKKTSVMTGFYRLLSLALATILAYYCFTFFGFTAIAFGIFLLLFIRAAVFFKYYDGFFVCYGFVLHIFIGKK